MQDASLVALVRRTFASTVLLGLLLSCQQELSTTSATTAPTPQEGATRAQLCYIYFPASSATSYVWHAHFSLREYHFQYINDFTATSNVTFDLKVIHQNYNLDPTIAVQAVVEMGSDCDIFLGPLSSAYASAIAPIVTTPMIAGATSTALSNKYLYEYFSRTTPSDDDAGYAMAATMHHLGVEEFSIICTEDSFGISLASAVRQHFKGKTSIDLCLPHTASKDEMLTTLNLIKAQSTTSVLVLSMIFTDGLLDVFEDALEESGVADEFTFFLSDVICTDLQGRRSFLGSFCPLQGINRTATAAYKEQWALYNKSKLDFYSASQEEGGVGLYPHRDRESCSVFDLLIADDVFLATTAFQLALANNPGLQQRADRGAILMKYIRNTTIFGNTGELRLDPVTGNRAVGILDVFNVHPSNELVPVGTFYPSSTQFENAADQDWYFVSSGMTNPDSPPSFVRDLTKQATANNLDYSLAIFVVIVIAVLVVFLFTSTIFSLRHRSLQSIHNLCRHRSFWLVVGGICAFVADISSDIAGLYVVMSRDSPLPFIILYGILTFAAVIVSSMEAFRMMKFFRIHCRFADSADGVPMHLLVFWNQYVAQFSVLSLVVEDIPILALATAAVIEEKNVILLLSLSISSLAMGYKLGKVGMVLRTLTQADYASNLELELDEPLPRRSGDNNDDVDNFARSFKRKDSTVSLRESLARSVLGGANSDKKSMSLNLCGLNLSVNSPKVFKQRVVQLLDPDRLATLGHKAKELALELSDFDTLEYFAVLKPILDAYEGYGKDDVEIDENEFQLLSAQASETTAVPKLSRSKTEV